MKKISLTFIALFILLIPQVIHASFYTDIAREAGIVLADRLQGGQSVLLGATYTRISQGGTSTTVAPTLGVVMTGNSSGGWDYTATSTLNITAVDLDCTDCLNETQIEDIYLLNNADDITTGQLTAANFVGSDATATSTFAAGFTVQTSALVVQDDSGFVGIGIATPSQKLTVLGAGVLSTLINSSDNQAQLILDGTRTGNAGVGVLRFDNAGDSIASVVGHRSGANDAGKLTFSTQKTGESNTERMVIDTAGNVGIGTTTPGSLLSVGDTSGINFSTGTSTFSSAGGIDLQGGCFAVNGTCVGAGSGADQTPWTQNIDAAGYDLTDVGSLGIGTTTPSGFLSIKGSDGTTNPFIIGSVGSSPELVVSKTGLVGIGTYPTASALEVSGSGSFSANLIVNGDIGLTGTRVTKGWFTDLTVTNAIAGSVTGSAGTVTTIGANQVNDTHIDWGTGANQVSVADLSGDQVSGALLWNLGGATSLEIPNGASPTVDATGEIAIDTTSDQLIGYGSAKRVYGDGYFYPAFSYATSTAWSTTGTTTRALGTAFIGETWSQVQCYTNTGTLNVNFTDGTNKMDMLTASTTVGTFNLVTNNTFTASEKRYVEIGTPDSSPTKISCTVRKALTAD